MLVTIAATVLLVVVLDEGPLGVLIGTFAGTLAVYAVLLVRGAPTSASSSTGRCCAQ